MSSPAPTAAAPRAGIRHRPRPADLVAFAGLGLFLLAAVAPGALAPNDPTRTDLTATLAAPSAQHWFGTDEIGRDLYTRIVHGTGQSLAIGAGAAATALVLALLLAGLAALAPRWVRGAADRLIEILFSFPALLLALLLVAVLGPSPFTLIAAVGVGCAPGYARMIRGQLLGTRVAGYVTAAVASGHSSTRIVLQHIVPNALRPLVAVFSMSVGQCVVWSSSLSFLGLGVAPPSPEWGALLDAGRTYLTAASWLVVAPGLCIVLLALTATATGRILQQHLERGE
ncbi:ABC transporter permease [Saccharopolyspora sp. HNM0983]|uniref:ABC transporter permease n=1 Tax=Saccharopolyspora montiporae TaxID=2781240 RepID=A0A929FZE6_9PSEU|nr:ABC transporter permease [Saccharopolyspora sp. HNM0983]MBE9373657.1 ABC transporter permease [Saccharopolyspora sp. HNM0983]